MCSPTLVIGLLSVAVSVAGQGMRAKSEADALRGNAEIADRQAALDDERAEDAIARGGERVFARRLTQAQMRGRQKAVLAARGLSLAEGSAFDILEDTEYLSELDVNMIKTNAEREAWGFRERAKMRRFQAGQLRSGVSSTLMLGQVSAFGTALTGTADVLVKR